MSPEPERATAPDAEDVEVVVVGAGPAGMAAAAAAAGAGCAVTVVDTYPTAGGQFHRRPSPGLDVDDGGASAPDPPDPSYDALLAAGRIRVRTGATVWAAAAEAGRPPFTLHLEPGDRPLRARTVVLATGATDRVLPFPGWDLPGVFTAGGAQALLKGQGVLVGERVVVGGSGPFLLPVAAGLAAAGCAVAAVAEAQGPRTLARGTAGWSHPAKAAEALRYLGALARHRVPVRPATAVTAAAGEGRVEQVTISRLGADWAPLPGRDRTVPVDAVCVSFGFVPQLGLGALLGCAVGPDPVWGDPAVVVDDRQATSVEGLFAAGEVTGVAGADAAAVEGAIAGFGAAAALGRLDLRAEAPRLARLERTRRRQRRFTALLGRMYPTEPGWRAWLTDDTIVCRCEEVPHRAVREALEDLGASDLRSVKLTTRCGMGYCQGRMCGSAVAALVQGATGTPPSDAGALSTPSILTPVTLARLAELADEEA